MTAITKTAWIMLCVVSAIALGACAQIGQAPGTTAASTLGPRTDSAEERGVEVRPPLGIHATIAPEFAPTGSANPLPPPESGQAGLASDGLWVLYCDLAGRASLMDLDGRGRHVSPFDCPAPEVVSLPAGLALVASNLIQLPDMEGIRWACCEPAAWAADGSHALLSNPGPIGGGTELIVYDVAADRFRQLVRSSYEITPLGISPDGRWAVYQDIDRLPQTLPNRQPPGQVMAISTDRRETRAFFSIYGIFSLTEFVLGWLSDSTFLVQHQDEPCGGLPQNLELLHADLEAGQARHIFDKHSYAALDPESHTVLLQELPVGPCFEASEPGPLVYLSAGDGWVPHPVVLPAEWRSDWEIRHIDWHPELGLFSVMIGESGGGPLLRLITLTTAGTIVHEFRLLDAVATVGAGLFPSPDGDLVVLAAGAPHGARLYDASGRLVKVLASAGGELGQGVQHALWRVDGSAVWMTIPDGPGIYRSAADEGWEPILVEPNAKDGTDLTLVKAPARPFQQTCGGRSYTRLRLGDRVMVSHEPPFPSRLRSDAGLAGSVVGMMRPGEQAEVLDGPVCEDEYVWWYLRPDQLDVSGWAAEGDSEGGWLLLSASSSSDGPPPIAVPAGSTATPLPAGPLSQRGPWLIGLASDAPDLIRALEADGTSLTRLPGFDFPHAPFDLRDGVSERHSLIGLRGLACGITECDYRLHLFKLPTLEPSQSIDMLYPSLAWDLGHGRWDDVLSANPALMAVSWEGAEPAILWSPDGRYLAFVGAIDGPSADVYAYDSTTSQVLRLTDGPGHPVLMGWSPDSRWVVHMEAEFAVGTWGPDYDPVAVWAADVKGGPATYLYASRGAMGASDEIIGWRSDREFVAVGHPAIGRMSRMTQVDVMTGTSKTLYAGEVASAAVDPASGTVAFVPFVPGFFPLQGNSALEAPTPTPRSSGAGLISKGGIYLIRRGVDAPERLDYDDWHLAYANMEWIPEAHRFFSAWATTVSFSANGEVDKVFDEHFIPEASPDGRWLVFRRPAHFPGIAVYTVDGEQIYEVTGLGTLDIVWRRDSSGFYLHSAPAGLRFFSTRSRSLSVLHPSPGFNAGVLQLVYP